jgi:ABC-2 type transport system ATP-binding protein
MIEVKNLSRYFGKLKAVDDVSFEVKDGEIFGFLGPNGAGKTTTVRMLCTLISPSSGTAKIEGFDIKKDGEQIRNITGLLPENPGFYDRLSLYRNLEFYARLYGVPEDEILKRIKKNLKMVGLWDRRDSAIATFSKGMKQKAAIIRAILHEPKYMFFDEPTAGLDPSAAKTIRKLILELKQKNKVIFLNTHNLDEAERICDRVAIIKSKIVAIDAPSKLKRSVYSSRIVVRLGEVPKDLKKTMGGYKYEVDGKDVLFKVKDPEKENPEIVSRLAKTGAKIIYVKEEKHSLEDVYLKIIGER